MTVFALFGALSLLLGCTGATAATEDSPSLPARQPQTPATEPLVSGFRLACDARHWRAGFALAAPARVSGRLQRRVGERWTMTRPIAPKTLAAGAHAVELGRLVGARSYRVRLEFSAGPALNSTVSRTFRATCTDRSATPLPLSDQPGPSLPLGGVSRPGDGSGDSSTGSTGPGTTGAGP
jgi:hypothetical protein